MSIIRHSILRAALLPVSLAAVLAMPAAAQQAQLAPQAARITDEAIHADLAGYESVQGRIKALNDAGRPIRDYHLAKAQCWLDVSFHEYTRNDRSDFPQAALTESEKLIVGMEQGVSPLPADTPLVNGAARLREDLWRRFGALHGAPGFACAAQAAACGEVELVHAGNEFNQQQWRHSKPYIQIAEELVGDAEAMARQCAAAELAASAAPATAAAPPATGVLTANVLFEFDRTGRADIRRYTLATLEREMARLREEGLALTGVALIGHADRLQGRGFEYNQALSEKRARTVRDLLVERGIEAGAISYTYRGDTEQVQQCEDVSPRVALRECLIPNRRVEVLLHYRR